MRDLPGDAEVVIAGRHFTMAELQLLSGGQLLRLVQKAAAMRCQSTPAGLLEKNEILSELFKLCGGDEWQDGEPEARIGRQAAGAGVDTETPDKELPLHKRPATLEEVQAMDLHGDLMRISKTFRARWSTYDEKQKKKIREKFDRGEAKEFVADCHAEGDFDPTRHVTVRHPVRLRVKPDETSSFHHQEDSGRTVPVSLDPGESIIKLREVEKYGVEFAYVVRVQDRKKGYVRAKYIALRRVDDFARAPSRAFGRADAARSYMGGRKANPLSLAPQFVSIEGCETYALPHQLLPYLKAQIEYFDIHDRWVKQRAFKRDVVMEGRMTQFGARPGYEITDQYTTLSSLTYFILFCLGYPGMRGDQKVLEEKRIAVRWNRYDPEQEMGCPPHKNWYGTKNNITIRFGDGSCAFSFHRKRGDPGDNDVVETNRIKDIVMVLAGPSNYRYLHSVSDIRGGIHYSLAVSTICEDVTDIQDWKRNRVCPDAAREERSQTRAQSCFVWPAVAVAQDGGGSESADGDRRDLSPDLPRAGSEELAPPPSGRDASRQRDGFRYVKRGGVDMLQFRMCRSRSRPAPRERSRDRDRRERKRDRQSEPAMHKTGAKPGSGGAKRRRRRGTDEDSSRGRGRDRRRE